MKRKYISLFYKNYSPAFFLYIYIYIFSIQDVRFLFFTEFFLILLSRIFLFLLSFKICYIRPLQNTISCSKNVVLDKNLWFLFTRHTVILLDWIWKKWGHSNFAFQSHELCNKWHPMQKDFLKSCEGFLRAALPLHGNTGSQTSLKNCQSGTL